MGYWLSHLLDPSGAEFWVLVALIIFLYFAWGPAKKAINAGLDARAAGIQASLDEAAKLRAEAEAMRKEAAEARAQAERDAVAMIAHAKEEAARITAEARTELAESLKRREAMAMDRIAQAEAAAAAELRAAAADAAVAAARVVITQSLSPERARALVGEAIKDVPSRLH
ncbi:MAG: F0F1 ATP synthase subunit B [Alphaproteobacteria bacterium]|nr:F0F1 ATP synthase subunit B [Alphaproteobacteria bacterium]